MAKGISVAEVKLQFGHGCDAVETRRTASSRSRTHGFNSATVVTPWKLRLGESTAKKVAKLQFGHGCDAVETATTTTVATEIVAASIRPRL